MHTRGLYLLIVTYVTIHSKQTPHWELVETFGLTPSLNWNAGLGLVGCTYTITVGYTSTSNPKITDLEIFF